MRLFKSKKNIFDHNKKYGRVGMFRIPFHCNKRLTFYLTNAEILTYTLTYI